MANSKLVMVQILDAQKILQILDHEQVSEFTKKKLINIFDGCMRIIENQPEHEKNLTNAGFKWMRENWKSRNLQEGDRFRAILLKGNVKRIEVENEEVDDDDVDSEVKFIVGK